MNIEPPIILDDQEPIIQWVKELRVRHITVSSIIEFLVSNQKTESHIIGENLEYIRKLYNAKNSEWREQVLFAILIDAYRKKNDIREGQIVTNGEVVGFAYDFNLEERLFGLYTEKSKDRFTLIDVFGIDDFKKV